MSVGVFDWLRTVRSRPDPSAWDVRREGDEVVVLDASAAKGQSRPAKELARFPRATARAVRVVPLSAGAGHGGARGGTGWQVAVRQAEGDLPIGRPVADWRGAREVARRLCEVAGAPLDELTERLFSQVGQVGGAGPEGRQAGSGDAGRRG